MHRLPSKLRKTDIILNSPRGETNGACSWAGHADKVEELVKQFLAERRLVDVYSALVKHYHRIGNATQVQLS